MASAHLTLPPLKTLCRANLSMRGRCPVSLVVAARRGAGGVGVVVAVVGVVVVVVVEVVEVVARVIIVVVGG